MHNNQNIHQVSGESVTSSSGRNTEAKLINNSVFPTRNIHENTESSSS